MDGTNVLPISNETDSAVRRLDLILLLCTRHARQEDSISFAGTYREQATEAIAYRKQISFTADMTKNFASF